MKVITHKNNFIFSEFRYKAIKLSQKELEALKKARVIVDNMRDHEEIDTDYAMTLHNAEHGLFEILDEHKKKDCFQLEDTLEVDLTGNF